METRADLAKYCQSLLSYLSQHICVFENVCSLTQISPDLPSTRTSVRAAKGLRTRLYCAQLRAYGVSQHLQYVTPY